MTSEHYNPFRCAFTLQTMLFLLSIFVLFPIQSKLHLELDIWTGNKTKIQSKKIIFCSIHGQRLVYIHVINQHAKVAHD